MEEKSEEYQSDYDRLERVKAEIMRKIEAGEFSVKVGDLLKVVELQKRMSTDSSAEQAFWDAIEQIRQGELRHD